MKRLFLATLIALPPSVALAQDATDQGPYSAIVERPLFDPSRKKYVPPPPPPPAPVATTDDTAPPEPDAPMPDLIGVVKSDDDAFAIAIVKTGDGQVLRVAVGEQVDGWRITSIDTSSVAIERDGDQETLDMPVVANSGSPPPNPDDSGLPVLDDSADPNSGDQ